VSYDPRGVPLATASAADHSELPLTSFASISVPHTVSGLRSESALVERHQDNVPGYAAARLAIERLWRGADFPTGASSGLFWRRDALGRPYIGWSREAATWAEANGLESRHLHVSNTHDGGAHIVIAAYSRDLVGIGIDAVWLPRLRRPGKDAAYFRRFARQFMSPEEWTAFESGTDHPFAPWSSARTDLLSHQHGEPQDTAYILSLKNSNAEVHASTQRAPASEIQSDPDEPLRVRVAAHFSLMEAASKACGTGLRIGVGMGRETSLPKQSLGALRVAPQVELVFGPEARSRLNAIGASHYESCVHGSSEFLISVVALYRAGSEKSEKDAGGNRRET
jgi:phosphopantetheinyl transferase (holo-ACP synthase)